MKQKPLAPSDSVLVDTRSGDFASVAVDQLSGRAHRILIVSEDEHIEAQTLRELAPEIAYISVRSKSTSGSPMIRLITRTCPNCSVVLIGTSNPTDEAAHFARTLKLRVLETVGREAPSANLTDVGAAKITRVLVVDDDQISGEFAKVVLEESGYVVDVARSPESARFAFDRHCPDLVLMDVHLGHANGVKLVAAMRKGTVFPEVPVVMVTSDRTYETVTDAASVKIQGYIIKPFDTRFLIKKIRNVLRESQPGEEKVGN